MSDTLLGIFLVAVPIFFTFLYFLPFKEKNEDKALQMLEKQRIMIIVYFMHGIIDWVLGISFVGYWLDMIIELVFPIVIVGLSGITSLFHKDYFTQRFLSLLIPLYFMFGWILSTIFNIPIVTGKYPSEEIFNGNYFRIEQGGSIVKIMNDNFHGTNIRYYKKYFLFEYRCKNEFFYRVQNIETIDETFQKLIYKIKFSGISEKFPIQTLE